MTTWPEDYRSGVSDSIARARADLAAALDGVELDDQEQKIVAWLNGWDVPTLAAITSIVNKARSTGAPGCVDLELARRAAVAR